MNEALAYGVNIESAPSGPAWRAVLVRHLTPEQNGSSHNVFVDVVDAAGNKLPRPARSNYRIGWKWDGGPELTAPLDKQDALTERGHGDIVIGKGARVSVWLIGDGLRSDRVTNMHTSHPDEPTASGELWNTIGHHSFYVRFQRSETAIQPQATISYITATSGLNLRERPTTGAKVLRTIAYAEQVTITGAPVGEWLPATYQGQAGYLFTQYVDTSKPTTDGVIDDFARALGWVLKEEGGYANNPNDRGGETNFGISKGAYPDLDIKALTIRDAIAIYRRDYWLPSGASTLPWPSCLAVFDGAVQHGVDVSRSLWSQSGGNRLRYMGLRLQFYGAIPNVDAFEKPWGNRMGRLLLEVSK